MVVLGGGAVSYERGTPVGLRVLAEDEVGVGEHLDAEEPASKC